MYDKQNLAKFITRYAELAPDAFKAFVAFDEAVVRGGVVPLKYKELIAVGPPSRRDRAGAGRNHVDRRRPPRLTQGTHALE